MPQVRGRRRFRRLPRQEVIPSQIPPNNTPYISTPQTDLRAAKRYASDGPVGYQRAEPYVVSQFDARPINGVDFLKTFSTAEQAAVNGTALATFTFNVPDGKIAIFRNFFTRFYTTASPRATNGAPSQTCTLAIAVNNNPADPVALHHISDAVCGPYVSPTAGQFVSTDAGLNIPLYFIAPAKAAVTFTYTLTANTFTFIQPVITGNLLLDHGLNPNYEPGTQAAVPTFPSFYMQQPRGQIRGPK